MCDLYNISMTVSLAKEGREVCYGLIYVMCHWQKRGGGGGGGGGGGYAAFTLIVGHQNGTFNLYYHQHH